MQRSVSVARHTSSEKAFSSVKHCAQAGTGMGTGMVYLLSRLAPPLGSFVRLPHCHGVVPLLSFVCVDAPRMGFAYGNEQVIQHMNNVKAPYNVNRLTQEVALRVLRDRTLYLQYVSDIKSVRGLGPCVPQSQPCTCR